MDFFVSHSEFAPRSELHSESPANQQQVEASIAEAESHAEETSVPARPDPSFGVHGEVEVHSGTKRIVEQADGKLLLIHRTMLDEFGNTYAYGISRYTSDGKLDTTFGEDGSLVIGPSQFLLEVLADGSFYVASHKSITPASIVIEVRKYLASGTLDTSFATDGKVSLESDQVLNDILVDGDGDLRLLRSLALDDGGSRGEVIRIDDDGQVEVVTAYSIAGPQSWPGFRVSSAQPHSPGVLIVTTRGAYRGLEPIEFATLLPDGQVLLQGAYGGIRKDGIPEEGTLAFARITADGELDAAYGTSGLLVTGVPLTATAPAIKSTGEVVIAFHEIAEQSSLQRTVVVAFTEEGKPDPQFGSSGRINVSEAELDWSTYSSPWVFATAGANEIHLSHQEFTTFPKKQITRVRSDGSLIDTIHSYCSPEVLILPSHEGSTIAIEYNEADAECSATSFQKLIMRRYVAAHVEIETPAPDSNSEPPDSPTEQPRWDFHNVDFAVDVNMSGGLEPLDYLVLLNDIARNGIRKIEANEQFAGIAVDVNNDQYLTPIDLLIVLNRLNEKEDQTPIEQLIASMESRGPDAPPNEEPTREERESNHGWLNSYWQGCDVSLLAEDDASHANAESPAHKDLDAALEEFVDGLPSL